MKSTEKILTLVDAAARMSDLELADAIPFPAPAPVVRGALAAIAGQLPSDAGELDRFLEGVSEFALSLRSDVPVDALEASDAVS